MGIGKNLQRVLGEKGVTAKELAEQLGIEKYSSLTSYMNQDSSNANPKFCPDLLYQVSIRYGVTFAELVGYEEDELVTFVNKNSQKYRLEPIIDKDTGKATSYNIISVKSESSINSVPLSVYDLIQLKASVTRGADERIETFLTFINYY